jgi:hypothetical protein
VCMLITDKCSTQFLWKYRHNQQIQIWFECIAVFTFTRSLIISSLTCQRVKNIYIYIFIVFYLYCVIVDLMWFGWNFLCLS